MDLRPQAAPAAISPRAVAEAHMTELVGLDPLIGSYLGEPGCADRLPDLSPEGHEDRAALARRTLTALGGAPAASDSERICARLLRERLSTELALYEAGEHLRRVATLGSPLHLIRKVFTLAPTGTDDDWHALARRMRALPTALDGYRASLEAGLDRRLPAGPTAVGAVIDQLATWTGPGAAPFHTLAAQAPQALRTELAQAADQAVGGYAELRAWLRDSYAPRVADAPDPFGADRYRLWSRHHNGADLDLDEAYAYGWSEYHRLLDEMRDAAQQVLPSCTDPWKALAHLEEHGEAIEGADAARLWLQSLTERTIEALDGTHFTLADEVGRVETRLAPEGTTAAYYTGPALDFSRPGRTWLPVLGTRFPLHDMVTTWYHEAVPGHHLQVAQWTYVGAERLTRFQASVGVVNANVEGWALYAERLMDELGFLTRPDYRLGYLQAQMLRTLRVIVDIGIHLELRTPADSPYRPGQPWTAEAAAEFLHRHSARPAAFTDAELLRYQSNPAQAVGYKLGERAWLNGRDAARARGRDTALGQEAFDIKAWHMEALSQGPLGLDDLSHELAAL
ncbi:DUF885 domain-containing protein [Streptomyces sp. NPDC050418]|uniref:DUF885 domain-containing protein n=1 Tax=Streptomyces sp. NPDC050418 TaxID=3365612 RepID=UPI00378F468B